LPNQVDILTSSGVAPYDVYVCDITNTFCYLVATGVSLPYQFNVPPPLDNTNDLIIKIIDSNGCEYFEPYSCPVTPTQTPTLTQTPTPTNPFPCNCIVVSNVSLSVTGFLDYIDCSGVQINSYPIGGGQI